MKKEKKSTITEKNAVISQNGAKMPREVSTQGSCAINKTFTGISEGNTNFNNFMNRKINTIFTLNI